MGILKGIAEMIVREHVWKPIGGQVVTVGRQAILLNPAEAVEFIRSCDCPVSARDVRSLEPDRRTRFSQSGESEYIRDTDFFGLLGIHSVKALDVSDYEGAEIIHDLNLPIPEEMEATADFIIDGSTLDNTFNPAAALQNMSRMLRPGGRMISFNVGTNSYCPYVMVTPLWVFDYFVVNQYIDCKMYIIVYKKEDLQSKGFWVFGLDPSLLHRDAYWWDNFKIQPGWDYDTFDIAVLAEKGTKSTWERTPIQHCYRSPEMWDPYERSLGSILRNNRPDLLRSYAEGSINCGNPLYVYIDKFGTRVSAPDTTDAGTGSTNAARRQDTDGIVIIEATYGWNCRNDLGSKEAPFSWVAPGNVTAAVALECDGKEECEFCIDVNKLGDPASGMEKDFTVRWRYGNEDRVYEAYVSPEAHGKTVKISRTGSGRSSRKKTKIW